MALKSTLESTKARLDALLTYANETTGESDTSIGDAIQTLCAGFGGGGGTLKLELIGTWTGYLPEVTDGAKESVDTDITISNQLHKYPIILSTISCDGVLDASSNKNWNGLTVSLGGRALGGRYSHAASIWYPGVPILEYTTVNPEAVSTRFSNGYGVYACHNQENYFQFYRISHATNCPKIMSGNYTVNVYGIVGI